MALTKTLFGAWVVSVGASECVNATLAKLQVPPLCMPTDVAVASGGTVWLTSTCSVWMCPEDGDCAAIDNDFDTPQGIAVHENHHGETVLYISQVANHSTHATHGNGVMKCTLNGQTLDCLPFGEDWDAPRGLTLDREGNVLVTNAYSTRPSHALPFLKTHGVWKCSPTADCVLVTGSDRWLEAIDMGMDVAADSKGNVYMSGHQYMPDGTQTGFLEKCISHEEFGRCDEFGPRRRMMVQGVAVGPDDSVYMRDQETHRFTRCSPSDICHEFGPDGFRDGPIAIDRNGVIYTFTDSNAVEPHTPEVSQLTLLKFCFDSPKDLLV